MNRHQIRTSLGPAYAMKSDREIDRIVLAVLDGVREPSDEIADAGADCTRGDTNECYPSDARQIFRAMIDALISEVRGSSVDREG